MTTCTCAGGCAGCNYPFLTLKERDNETGLDYFLARYYSSTQGRFTSPDEFSGGPDELYDFAEAASENPTFYADLRNPQSLNKYQYAFNNPLRYVDPDGHDADEPEPDPQGQGKSVPIPAPPLPFRPMTPQEVEITRRGLQEIGDAIAEGYNQQKKANEAQQAGVVATVLVIVNALLPSNVNPQAIPPVPITGTPPQTQAQPQTATPAQMSPRPIDKPRDQGHRKGKRGHDKHTRKTPGESRPPGFKPRVPRRPQDMPPKPTKPPKGKNKEGTYEL